jgi:hypothetical protein
MLELTDIAVHAGIGSVFALTGACVRGACEHTKVQHAGILAFFIAVVLIFIEATVMVWAVG